MYSRTLELKASNNIKVLLAVGGWNFGSAGFSDMVANEQLRKEFVQQATQFIRDHRFDGLDIDWV
jgi:chitinase